MYLYLPHLASFHTDLVIFELKCPELTLCAIFTLYIQHFKTIEQLFMEILHLQELEDTENVVTNGVWVFMKSLTFYFCSFYQI